MSCYVKILRHSSLACDLQTYPYTVTLMIRQFSFQICGGTLLHTRWVLSAAHCIYNFDKPSQLSIKSKTNLYGFLTAPVERIFRHDLYDPKTLQNDVSLLFLADVFPAFHQYGKLAGKAFTQTLIEQEVTNAHIMAWKINLELAQKKNVIKNEMIAYCIQVNFIRTKKCQRGFGQTVDLKLMCCVTSGPHGEAPCRGDSGSPMFYQGAVVGLVSFGASCQILGLPSVLTRIDYAIDFFRTTVEALGYSLVNETFRNHTVYSVSSGNNLIRNYCVIWVFFITMLLRCIIMKI